MDSKLVVLYAKMAELTKPKCQACRAPMSCCDSMYCDMAIETAKASGEVLTHTGHKTLPMMGENGCVAPPHFRPLCTLHVCSINNLGFDPKDPAWTKEYFKLRAKIEKLDWTAISDGQ